MTVIPRFAHLPLATLISTLSLSAGAMAAVEDPADIIFYGGPILTMDDTYPNVDAVAVDNGLFSGSSRKSGATRTFRFWNEVRR